MATTLTAKEIARRIAPSPEPAIIQHVLRQVRHWTASSLLEMAGPIHVGQGRARAYEGQAVYTAAILLAFATYDVPVAVLSLVSHYLHSLRASPKTMPAMVQAIEGQKDVYLWFNHEGVTESGDVLEARASLFYANQLEAALGAEDHAIVVNLTKIFAKVRR